MHTLLAVVGSLVVSSLALSLYLGGLNFSPSPPPIAISTATVSTSNVTTRRCLRTAEPDGGAWCFDPTDNSTDALRVVHTANASAPETVQFRWNPSVAGTFQVPSTVGSTEQWMAPVVAINTSIISPGVYAWIALLDAPSPVDYPCPTGVLIHQVGATVHRVGVKHNTTQWFIFAAWDDTTNVIVKAVFLSQALCTDSGGVYVDTSL